MQYGTIRAKDNAAQLLSETILHQYEGGGSVT